MSTPVTRLRRGDVIALPGLGGPSDFLDVMLGDFAESARPLKDGVRVRVHHGSGNVPAHVALGSGEEAGRRPRTRAASAGVAGFVFAGDRFTVRDWSGQQTLAGASSSIPTRRAEHFATASDRCGWRASLDLSTIPLNSWRRTWLATSWCGRRAPLRKLASAS